MLASDSRNMFDVTKDGSTLEPDDNWVLELLLGNGGILGGIEYG